MVENVGLRISATGDFSQVIGQVHKLQSELSSLKIPGKLGEGIDKNISKMTKEMEKFYAIREKSTNTKGDLTNMEKSARVVGKAYESIIRDLQKAGKLDDKAVKKFGSFDTDEIRKLRAEAAAADKVLNNFKNKKNKIDFDYSSLEKFATKSKVLQDRISNLKIAIDTGDLKQAESLFKKIEDMGKSSASKPLKSILNNKELGGEQGYLKTLSPLRQLITEYQRLEAKANEAHGVLNKSLDIRVSNIQGQLRQIASGFDTAGVSAQHFMRNEQAAAQEMYRFNSQLGTLQSSANYFFGLDNMFRLLRTGIRSTLDTVKELDKAMTDTAVVTDFSVPDMWAKLPQYTKLANELGATTKGAYETMTLYYQQGLNTEQAFAVGTETMKMARIAGLDYADTTNMMTAALRGFNMEIDATSAKRVNDVYSKLAAITASDTRELGQAMERTASIAHSAGMDFGNTSAFLAQMIETTREAPENLGTAMKTIVARFQELKENPGKISEVDGEEVNYNRIDKALKSIGVSLVDNKDKFRDLDDVFMDISERWDSLTQMQQRYVATTAAGSRQQSRFIAMVGNYQRLQQLTDAAANSEGASDVQFAKTLDSMEAKLNKFHNAWNQFKMGITDNKLLKGAVDVLTDIVDVINKITDGVEKKLGSVNKAFGAVAKSVLSLGIAFAGLSLAGKGINKGLGAVGNLIDPQGKTGKGMFGGFFGGMTGRRMANNAQLASQINQPIVSVLNSILSVLSKGSRDNLRSRVRQDINGEKVGRTKNALYQNLGVSKEDKNKTFSSKEVKQNMAFLNNAEKDLLFKNSPALRQAYSQHWQKAIDGMKLDEPTKVAAKEYVRSLSKNLGKESAPVSEALAKTANPYIMSKHVPKEIGEAFIGSIDQQIKEQSYKLDKGDRKKVYNAARKAATGREGFSDLSKKEQHRAIRNEYRGRLQEATRAKFAHQNMNWGGTSDLQLGSVAKNMSKIFSSATAAGQAINGMGMALQSVGFTAAGGVFTTIGNGVMGIGMAAEGAVASVKLLKTGLAGLGISMGAFLAATAGIAAVVAAGVYANKKEQERIKEIRKAGQEVTKNYEEETKKASENLNTINEYRAEFKELSKGVDSNGNNINLGTEEYRDYQKIVKELVRINPKLVEGYNAQGQAIIDNNKAIEESLKLQSDNQTNAIAKYTKTESLQDLIDARNTTKRFGYNSKNLYDTIQIAGKTGKQIKAQDFQNQFERDANNFITSIKNLGTEGDKVLQDLTDKYKVDFTKVSDDLIRTMGTHGSEIMDFINDQGIEMETKQSEAIQNSMATFGKHYEGFEKSIEPIYKNLSTYISQNNLFKDIPDQVRTVGEAGLKELAKLKYQPGTTKEVTGAWLQEQATGLFTQLNDLTKAGTNYADMMKEIEEKQKEFGRTGDANQYKEAADAIKDKYVQGLKNDFNLEGVSPQINKALQEDLDNALESIDNFTENAAFSLEQGFNSFADDITIAQGAYEAFQKDIESGDFYTAANSMKSIFDEVKDGIDDAGKGSQSYWKAVKELAGEKIANKGKKSLAERALGDIKPMLEEGRAGVDAFLDHVVDKAPEASDSFKKAFKDTGIKSVQDLMGFDEKGEFKFNLENLNDEQFSALAETLGMSDKMLTSMLNKARQFYDIDFSDWGLIRQGLMSQANEGNGAVQGTQAIDKEGSHRVYARKSELREQAREQGIVGKDFKQWLKDAKKQGVEAVTKGKLQKDLSKYTSDWGIDKKDDHSGIDFLKNLDALHYGQKNQEELYNQAKEQGLVKGGDFDSVFEAAQNEIKVAEGQPNSAEEATESNTARTAASAEALVGLISNGQLRDGALGTSNYKEAKEKFYGGKGDDTAAQKFARGNNFKNEDDYKNQRDKVVKEKEALEAEIESRKQGLGKIYDPATKKKAEEYIDKEEKLLGKYIKALDKGDKAWAKQEAHEKGKSKEKDKGDTSDKDTDSKNKSRGNQPKKSTSTPVNGRSLYPDGRPEPKEKTVGEFIRDKITKPWTSLSNFGANFGRTNQFSIPVNGRSIYPKTNPKAANSFANLFSAKPKDIIPNFNLGFNKSEKAGIPANGQYIYPQKPGILESIFKSFTANPTNFKNGQLAQKDNGEFLSSLFTLKSTDKASVAGALQGGLSLPSFIKDFISPVPTDKKGLGISAENIGAITQQFNQLGTEGQKAGLDIKTAFLEAHQDAISKMDGKELQGLMDAANITTEDLQKIGETHPKIKLDTAQAENDAKKLHNDASKPATKKVKVEEDNGSKPKKEETPKPQPKQYPGAQPTGDIKIDKQNVKKTLQQDMTVPVNPKIELAKPIKPEEEIKKATPKKIAGKLNVTAPVKVNYTTGEKGSNGSLVSKIKKGLSALKKSNQSITIKTKADDGAQKAINKIRRNNPVTIKTKANNTAQRAINNIHGTSVSVDISPNITGTWSKTFTVYKRVSKDKPPSTGGMISHAGVLYRARGGLASNPMFKRQGTDTIPTMLTPGEYVQNRDAVKYFGVDFMRKINHKDLNGALETFGSAAKGKYGTVGPKDKGGLTLTGEKGFEIAWLPSENRSMILGADGPQMINLPNDAVVYTNQQSKKIMRQKAIPAGSHSDKSAIGTAKGYKYKNQGDSSSKTTTTTTTTTTNNRTDKNSKNSKGKGNNNNKKDKEHTEKITKELLKQGKLNSKIFNLKQQIAKIDIKILQNQRNLNNLLRDVTTSIGDARKAGQELVSQLTLSLKKNRELLVKYQNQGQQLATGGKFAQRTVSWTNNQKVTTIKKNGKGKVKSKKTTTEKKEHKEKINFGDFTITDPVTGALQIDDAAINRIAQGKTLRGKETSKYKEAKSKVDKLEKKKKLTSAEKKELKQAKDDVKKYGNKKYTEKTGDKNQAKAIREAVQKLIEENQSNISSTISAINADEDKLDEYGKSIADHFYNWKNELTKIYEITNKIGVQTSKNNAFKAQQDLIDAKINSGMLTGTEAFNQSMKVFRQSLVGTADMVSLSASKITAIKEETSSKIKGLALGKNQDAYAKQTEAEYEKAKLGQEAYIESGNRIREAQARIKETSWDKKALKGAMGKTKITRKNVQKELPGLKEKAKTDKDSYRQAQDNVQKTKNRISNLKEKRDAAGSKKKKKKISSQIKKEEKKLRTQKGVANSKKKTSDKSSKQYGAARDYVKNVAENKKARNERNKAIKEQKNLQKKARAAGITSWGVEDISRYYELKNQNEYNQAENNAYARGLDFISWNGSDKIQKKAKAANKAQRAVDKAQAKVDADQAAIQKGKDVFGNRISKSKIKKTRSKLVNQRDNANDKVESTQKTINEADNTIKKLTKKKKKGKLTKKEKTTLKNAKKEKKQATAENKEAKSSRKKATNKIKVLDEYREAKKNIKEDKNTLKERKAKNQKIQSELSGMANISVDDIIKKGGLSIDTAGIEAAHAAGDLDGETYVAIKELADTLQNNLTELTDTYTEITEALTSNYQLLADLKTGYAEASQKLLEGLEKMEQDKIDQQKSLFDSMNDSFKSTLDKVSKNLSKRSQVEDNAEKTEDLQKKRNRLNSLKADTTGGNAVEIAQLEKDLNQSEKDFTRELEDQRLQQLQDQADAAAEQRERQIGIMQAQYDWDVANGTYAAQVDRLIAGYQAGEVSTQDKIKELWDAVNNNSETTEAQKALAKEEYTKFSTDLQGYPTKIEEVKTAIESLKTQEEKVSAAITNLTPAANDAKSVADSIKASEKVRQQEEAQKQKAAQEREKQKAIQSYNLAVANQGAAKKINADSLKAIQIKANDAGFNAKKYLADLAATNGLSWKQVLQAAKDSGEFSKYRIAATWSSDTFKKAYNEVWAKDAVRNNKGKVVKTAWEVNSKHKNAKSYKTGGLADYTGPAWLDGTPSKPELVLNAQDTANFLALKDILGRAVSSTQSIDNSDSAIFNIDIDVEQMANDYDADRMVERIKKEIVKSASYRNVTSVRHFR